MGSISPSKTNVLVVGSGGVGTMAAFALEKGGKANVTAVLRSNFDAVQKAGFSIKSIDHGEHKAWRPTAVLNKVPDVAAEHLLPFDYIVVATKNVPDVSPTVTDIISPAVTPGHTAIVLVQNGLNIEKPLVKAFPQNPIVSGVSLIGAEEGPLGNIVHNDHDELIIGPFSSPDLPYAKSEAAAKQFYELYGSCPGIDSVYQPDVKFSRWRKLLYNASFNTTATILGLDTTRIRVSETIVDELIRPIILEIMAAAKADGVELPADLVEKFIVIDPYEAFFKPSMCQDVLKGNFIEFENIAGEPLRRAEELGVAMPTLRVLYSLLKGVQWKTKEAKGLVQVPLESTPSLKYGDKS